MTKQDLELLSYDDLKNELSSRYHSVIFIGQKEDGIDHIDYIIIRAERLLVWDYAI